jgi:hypothetical protein
LVYRDHKELKEVKVLKELVHHKVLREPKVLKEMLGHQQPQVLDHKDLKALKEHKDFRGHKDHKDQRDLLQIED